MRNQIPLQVRYEKKVLGKRIIKQFQNKKKGCAAFLGEKKYVFINNNFFQLKKKYLSVFLCNFDCK
jgi:hypothetical protein